MSAETSSWVFERVLPSSKTTDAEKLLLVVLGDSHSPHNPCLYRPSRIAILLGWPEEKVVKTTESLRRKGLLYLFPSRDYPGEFAFGMGESHEQSSH